MKNAYEIKCPRCNLWQNKEEDSYADDYIGNSVFRCAGCSYTFTEFECDERKVPVKVIWEQLMQRYQKAEAFFSNSDITQEEKLKYEPDLHQLLDEIKEVEAMMNSDEGQLMIFQEG